jgi:hypothetical protein
MEFLLLPPEYSEVRYLASIGNPTSLPHHRVTASVETFLLI